MLHFRHWCVLVSIFLAFFVGCATADSDEYEGVGGPFGACVPLTCAELKANCGSNDNGCGGKIDCGTCTVGTCGGGAQPNVCGGGIPANCVKKTCADRGANCGPVADGCGALTPNCGTCQAPEACGGGGKPSVCGGGVTCTKKTCADYPSGTCGPMADGCGGLTPNCGSCAAPQTCGGGGIASLCGGGPPCVKKTCADTLVGTCGPVSDGCGGLTADCGTCVTPQSCGGGGVPSQCGGGPPPCTKKTCANYPVGTCGPMSDGCGGLTADCGGCGPTQTCGGGGFPSVCGGGNGPCTKKTCADYPTGTCGQVSDGCGGLTTDCGGCQVPQSCGGGNVPSTCGGAPLCVKKTCADYPVGTCGQVSDGCGGLTTNCGTCILPNTCGGGGVASKCGGAPPPCTKKTCADYPAGTCGQVSDGCGGLTTDCGQCTPPAICGGGAAPSQCGGGGGATCINLECKQVTCPSSGATTSISGVVYDPAGNNPLYNVFVYIPNGPTQTFGNTVTCDKCSDALSGFPLVLTVSKEDGSFKLTNVPVGTDIPLVIQTGKWRRQVKINTAYCVDTPIPKALTRLPRTKAEGDIPRIALSTGGFDTLECLLRKIGIADSEFTNPGGGGRVTLFTGAPNSGPDKAPSKYDAAYGGQPFPSSTQLWGSLASLQQYDVTLLSCEGDLYAQTKTAASLKAMYDYTNIGGRVFASHYHHYWVSANTNGTGTGAWGSLASWIYPSPGMYYNYPSNYPYYAYVPEKVVTGFSKGFAMATWFLNVGASVSYPPGYPSGFGTLTVFDTKNSVKSYDSSRVLEWIYSENTQYPYSPYTPIPRATQYMTFNAPTGSPAADQCGRFVFSDIHVSSGDKGASFPSECQSTTMRPQEKALEFMLFDLSSRVCDDKQPAPPPTCTKRTCADQGIKCGSAPDGCGGVIANCGTCASPLVCSTGGVCAGSSCVPTTCAALGLNCGQASDGCGGTLNCGTCVSPQLCGGGGVPGVCGGSGCMPTTCAALSLSCGSAADGCGGTLNCGPCIAPETCGGGGVAGKCGGGCQPTTCLTQGIECGMAADGCGNSLNCGVCMAAGQTCGGGGIPGKCGGAGCTPRTCSELNITCGSAADGCGGVLNCGDCIAPQTCGGGGVFGACGGGSCAPSTCAGLKLNCGSAPDGCGGTLSCGPCPTGQTCGGSGTPGQCGSATCTPTTCAALGVACGLAADGCGGTLTCGACQSPQTCGGGGVPGQCGGGCVRKTCVEMGVGCGPSGDGCGGIIECGPC